VVVDVFADVEGVKVDDVELEADAAATVAVGVG
jgi:hypothetical protein